METPDALVKLVESIENASALDEVDERLRPLADSLVADSRWRDLLQGRWLGHAIHPLMTDFPLGLWLSGTMLDLVGGSSGRTAARRLIGMGVLAALPTAATGLAESTVVEQPRDRRVVTVHAAVNSAALTAYAASWWARRRGHGLKGFALAVVGGTLATAGGYLGGHLTEVRKIATHAPELGGPDRGGPGPGD